MDYPTVTVHTGKRFKALIKSGGAISLMHTSVYNTIEDCYKTSILPAAIHLKTADRSPISSMYKATLHLCIADFEIFTHLHHMWQLPETNFLFGIDHQERYSLSYCWDSDRQLFIQKEGKFLTYTRNKEELHNITVIKSLLKIPPRHNGTIPIRIKGYDLWDHMAYLISNQNTKKGLDPNIHLIGGIYDIKGKSILNIIVTNYTNKHVTFSIEQGIGHVEPPIDNMPQTTVNSIIT